MASLETIHYRGHRPVISGDRIEWERAKGSPIDRLPQLCWRNGITWGEANLWALEQATNGRTDIKTVSRSMSHLLAYSNWLEAEQGRNFY